MHHRAFQVLPSRMAPCLISLLSLTALLAGCREVETPALASSVTPDHFNHPLGHGLRGAIAFHRLVDGDVELFVMNADGSGERQLSDNSAQDFSPIWSPDGNRIAFSSNRNGDFEIYTMRADGSGVTQLTHSETQQFFTPSWSPDGRRLLFTGVSVADGDVEAFVINSNGTGLAQLTNDAGITVPTDWSPDGKRIAFIRNGDIFSMRLDGSRVMQLTHDPAGDEGDHAGWSSDGKQFVFNSFRDGGDLEVLVMNADGSRVRQLTHNDTLDDDPAWSPDGKHIVFACEPDPGEDSEICVMNPDGTGLIQLTFNQYGDGVPSWRAKPLL